MKKFTAILISVSLLLCAACTKESSAPSTEPTIHTVPTDTMPAETPTETEAIPVMEDIPLLAFSAPITSEEYLGKDGIVLLTYAYQNLSLILEDPQIADAIVIDFLNYVDFENPAIKSLLSDAEDARGETTDWVPYSYSTFFTPERFDQSILSLYGMNALYSGNPRPATVHISVTYDLLSGRPLELKEILLPDFSADTLSQLICNALTPFADGGMLYADYSYVVSEMFTTNRPIDTWYLSEYGLCFYFAPYEIAPYSTGTVVAEIPYEDLTGILKDEYFPAEAVDHSGSVFIQPFQDPDRFNQFAELVIDSSAAQYLLYTDGCLHNVKIELGSWLVDGSFLADATIFAAAALCSSDAIMLQFAADMPQGLRLTYQAEGETITANPAEMLSHS